MEKDIYDTIDKAITQDINSGPKDLRVLAKRLAVWATENTINNGESRLREKGYALAGAIIDWNHELYPN